MTSNKKAKSAARTLAAAADISYTAARRATRQAPSEFLTAEDLLRGSVTGSCENLLQRDLSEIGDIEVEAAVKMLDPFVYSLEPDPDTLANYPVETYEGGTEVSNVQVNAALTIAGVVTKGEATMLEASKLAEIIDWDFNTYDALVVLTSSQIVQLEFDATYTVDAGSVEDMSFSGAIDF